MSELVRGRGNRRRGDNANLVRTRGVVRNLIPNCGDITVRWGREISRIGQQEPNASLSGFTTSWTDDSASPGITALTGSDLFAEVPSIDDTWYMKPVRYEFATAYGTATTYSGNKSVAARATGPITNGHIKLRAATKFILNFMVSKLNTSVRLDADRIWATDGSFRTNQNLRAVELFVNDVSVGLYDFGSSIPLTVFSVFRSIAIYSHNPIEQAIPDLSIGPEDVVSIDIYLTIDYVSSASGPTYTNIVASAYGTKNNGLYFDSPAKNICPETLQKKRFTFSDHGPGGVTNLTMKSQAGWTFTQTATQTQMTHIATSRVVRLNHGYEIPYIECDYPDQIFIPSGALRGTVRYYPNDTGDYLQMSVGISANAGPYGRWNPKQATVFQNRSRLMVSAPGSTKFWFYEDEDPSGTSFVNFPASITIQNA